MVTTTADRFTVAVADVVPSATDVAVTVTATGAAIDAGAVYKPFASIVPPPLTNHVTAVFAAFVTTAENCCVWPFPNVAVVGVTLTVTGGFSVIVAVADLLASATDVAVIVTVVEAAIAAGAVYKPAALTVPVAGAIVHVTAVFAALATVAVNCCVCPP